tara:strand:+ start:829 stop:1482 length:654 start_codon:yes stop_codon:yes gene_type:complete
MATQITPSQNSKLGTNSKTIAGSTYLSASRAGSGKSFDPYIDTVDLSSTSKDSISSNTSNITTLQNDVSTLKISNKHVSNAGKGESMTFNLDLSINSVGAQTLTISTIDIVNLTAGSGYGLPTIASVDATLGKNNRFLVNNFMMSDHSRFVVQATCENQIGFGHTRKQEEVNIEVSGVASDTFYFRLVDKKGIPLTNLQIAKKATLRLRFEISGTNR